MAKDTNRLLGHTDEADGIDEYDNPLPDWWLGLFWLTIVWALGYGIHYHFIGNRSAERELAAEMAAAEVRWPAQAADATQLTFAPDALAAGEAVYNVQCVACHGPAMEGGIGPSMLDDEWIHGSTPEDIVRTISDGVLEKGMLNWLPILGPEAVNQVAAYVISKNAEALGIPLPEVPGSD